MKILITAGNTQVPIDHVRVISNKFSGQTGARIALAGVDRGHQVVLLTSNPETFGATAKQALTVNRYETFSDLQASLEAEIRKRPDALIHSAAISDYVTGGIYAPAADAHFDATSGKWHGSATLVDRRAAKVKSEEAELWLRLVRAPKLVDCVRGDWGFRGLLVKFKLEAGISEAELLRIAEASRRHSNANLMVANTVEAAKEWAFLGPDVTGEYQKIDRPDLPARLLEAVELLYGDRHG